MPEQGLQPFQCQWPKQVHKPKQYYPSLTLFLKEKIANYSSNISVHREHIELEKRDMAQLQIHVALKMENSGTSVVDNRMLFPNDKC